MDVFFGCLLTGDSGISVSTEDGEKFVFTLDEVVELMDGRVGVELEVLHVTEGITKREFIFNIFVRSKIVLKKRGLSQRGRKRREKKKKRKEKKRKEKKRKEKKRKEKEKKRKGKKKKKKKPPLQQQ